MAQTHQTTESRTYGRRRGSVQKVGVSRRLHQWRRGGRDRLKQVAERSRVGLISITSTPGPRLSVSVSTNRKTHPIRDPPAGNGPTGHIACVLIPPLSGHSRSGARALDARSTARAGSGERGVCRHRIFGEPLPVPYQLAGMKAVAQDAGLALRVAEGRPSASSRPSHSLAVQCAGDLAAERDGCGPLPCGAPALLRLRPRARGQPSGSVPAQAICQIPASVVGAGQLGI